MAAQKFHGLLTRREAWRLSGRGWLVLLLLLAGAALLFSQVAYSFLALHSPVAADTLVVEGWNDDFVVRAAVREFRRGGYRQIYATGGPVNGSGGYTNDYNTYASVAGDRLKAAGLAPAEVKIAPARVWARNRTYGAAVALRERLRQAEGKVLAVNVVTGGPHARRTRLLFQKAFGAEAVVGVIAVDNPDFPREEWWRYSEGVKEVFSEWLAYLYAMIARPTFK